MAMKPYLFPFRLYSDDHKRRKLLEKTLRDFSGNKMSFALILRQLMQKEFENIRRSETTL